MIGTIQTAMAATGAVIGVIIYNGSVRNAIVIMAVVGIATTCVFLLRPWIAPDPIVHHPDELARE